MSRPKTIQYYDRTLDVHPAVWDHLLAQANEHKAWALNHEELVFVDVKI